MKPIYAIAIAIVIATLLFPAVLGEYNPMAGSTYIPSNSPGSVISLDNTGFELASGDSFTVSGKAFAKDPGGYLIKVSSFGVKLYDVKSSSPFNFELDFTMPDDNPSVEYYDVSIMKCDVFENNICKYFGIISPSVSQSFRIDNIDTPPSLEDPFISITSNVSNITAKDIVIIKGTASHDNSIDSVWFYSHITGAPVGDKEYLVHAKTNDPDLVTWTAEVPLEKGLNFIYIHAEAPTGESIAKLVVITHDPDYDPDNDSDDSAPYLLWGITSLVVFFILSKIPLGDQS